MLTTIIPADLSQQQTSISALPRDIGQVIDTAAYIAGHSHTAKAVADLENHWQT
jgi:hypothetical protein